MIVRRRRATREAYRIRRDRREVIVAVLVAASIVIATAVVVWILAPDDASEPASDLPSITTPIDTTPPDTTDATAPSVPDSSAEIPSDTGESPLTTAGG